jgi:membrane-associated phospholipid phosphatase
MLDFVIAKAVNEFGRGTILDYFSGVISSELLLAILFIFISFFVLKYDKKRGKIIFIALLAAMFLHFTITNLAIKDVGAYYGIDRLRPYIAHPGEIIPIGPLSTDSSFPSGHVASLTAFLFVLCYYYRKNWIWILSGILVIAMGFSRMHNGMHYPSDVLGGIIFGVIYGLIAVKIAGYFGKRKRK